MIKIALLLSAVLLASCAPATRKLTEFTLSPAQPVPALPLVLLLAPIDVAPVYMDKDLLYRLNYADGQLHAYANSRWYAPPIAMFAQTLRQTAGDNLLELDYSAQRTRCTLRLELGAFEQVFSDAHHSHAELKVNFSLLQLHNHLELGHDKLHIKIAADTADAHGGAKALDQASRQAARQIIAWLKHRFALNDSAASSAKSVCE